MSWVCDWILTDLIFLILDRPTVCTLVINSEVSMPVSRAHNISTTHKAQGVRRTSFVRTDRSCYLIGQVRLKNVPGFAIDLDLLPLRVAVWEEPYDRAAVQIIDNRRRRAVARPQMNK